MARDHHSDDQDNLFSHDGERDEAGSFEDDTPEGDGGTENSHPPDLSSEEERLRNGDISFRPVSLPGSEPEPSVSRTGTAGTALMIVVAIVVVLMITWVIYTFYSLSPSGPQQTHVDEQTGDAQQPLSQLEATSPEDSIEPARDEPAAIFQAHAELQENYRQAEQRISDLESELQTERSTKPDSTPVTGSPADTDRLGQLEKENSELKSELAQQRQESASAVSRAEQLVQRAESQVAEERGQARAARENADQSRQQAETLTTEKSVLAGEVETLRDQVNELQTELTRRKEEYDRLTANTTTRLEGESDAVRQLISRHAEELERERKATREKQAENRRLTELIARLSVADTGPGGTEPSRSAAPPSTGSSPSGSGVVSPPRILTRSEPQYPVNARRLRVEGTVVLNVLVGTDGRVREIKVLEADGGKLLSPAAVEAVEKWTFSPATRGGQPVECWHKVPIRFAL